MACTNGINSGDRLLDLVLYKETGQRSDWFPGTQYNATAQSDAASFECSKWSC